MRNTKSGLAVIETEWSEVEKRIRFGPHLIGWRIGGGALQEFTSHGCSVCGRHAPTTEEPSG